MRGEEKRGDKTQIFPVFTYLEKTHFPVLYIDIGATQQ